jgi:hypothetical protein
MPSVRKMTSDEITELEQRMVSHRKTVVELYDSLLSECVPNDEIEIELERDERRTTAITRLKAAAVRHVPPLRLEFKRCRDPLVLRFLVHAADGSALSTASVQDEDIEIPDLELDETVSEEAEWQPATHYHQSRYKQRSRNDQGSQSRQRFSKPASGDRPSRPGQLNRFERSARPGRQDRPDRAGGPERQPRLDQRASRSDQRPGSPNRQARPGQGAPRPDQRGPRPDQASNRPDQRPPYNQPSSRPFRSTDMPKGRGPDEQRDRQKPRRRPR